MMGENYWALFWQTGEMLFYLMYRQEQNSGAEVARTEIQAAEV